MSINENEPFPLAPGEHWEESSPQWLERVEYIEERTEAYIDNFRENPYYDFSMMDKDIEATQNALAKAYSEFAKGFYTVARVKIYAVALRDSFKLKIQAPKEQVPPPRNFARENWERKQRSGAKR